MGVLHLWRWSSSLSSSSVLFVATVSRQVKQNELKVPSGLRLWGKKGTDRDVNAGALATVIGRTDHFRPRYVWTGWRRGRPRQSAFDWRILQERCDIDNATASPCMQEDIQWLFLIGEVQAKCHCCVLKGRCELPVGVCAGSVSIIDVIAQHYIGRLPWYQTDRIIRLTGKQIVVAICTYSQCEGAA
jgi:hypothetical protein